MQHNILWRTLSEVYSIGYLSFSENDDQTLNLSVCFHGGLWLRAAEDWEFNRKYDFVNSFFVYVDRGWLILFIFTASTCFIGGCCIYIMLEWTVCWIKKTKQERINTLLSIGIQRSIQNCKVHTIHCGYTRTDPFTGFLSHLCLSGKTACLC